MKFRVLIRISIIVSIVLLCTGIGVYSFLRISSAENQHEFNLYTLVSQDAIAVFETDRIDDFVEEINQLNCSKDNHYLYVSDLFVYLKQYLSALEKETPHGLSKQMNKMLISFHEPDTPSNQVLYCTLGRGDYELVETFIKKYCSSTFPSKLFDYKGEEIRIYPMADGRFLAAYFTDDFLVVSFQKRLIEQAIDARRSKKSLMRNDTFSKMYTDKRNNVPATIYVRMKAVNMGKDTDGFRMQTPLGSWAEFDLKFKDNAIYCSGISHGSDTTNTFINALRNQNPIEGFSGDRLPATTFFYNQWALSDIETMLNFTSKQEYAKATYSDYIRQRDAEWMTFLKENACENVMSCLFFSKDTTDKRPCAVMSIPVKNGAGAELYLKKMLSATPSEVGAPPIPKAYPNYALYPSARNFRQYVLPRNTMLTQLTGITESALHTYACFYRGALLLAPDAHGLSAYMDALEKNEMLDGTSVYEEGVGSLAPLYNFVMMADMKEMMNQSETYVRLVPNFFFRHADFFRHFILDVQFTCVDGVVYPNIVLLYKGGQS